MSTNKKRKPAHDVEHEMRLMGKFHFHPKQAEFMDEPPMRIIMAGVSRSGVRRWWLEAIKKWFAASVTPERKPTGATTSDHKRTTVTKRLARERRRIEREMRLRRAFSDKRQAVGRQLLTVAEVIEVTREVDELLARLRKPPG